MADVEVDEGRRAQLVDRLVTVLAGTSTGAAARVRGSVAEGSGDRFSDIDVELVVHGNVFDRCLRDLRATLEAVRPIRLLRVDPDSVHAPDRRLVFVLFEDLPLFWRLDLDIIASPPPRTPTAALADVAWSPAASALMNAIATIKALARDNSDTAAGLLSRGFARIGEPEPTIPLPEGASELAAACARREPSLLDLANQVTELRDAFLAAE